MATTVLTFEGNTKHIDFWDGLRVERDYISWLVWEHIGAPLDNPVTPDEWKKMDGWMGDTVLYIISTLQ